ncbi:MAG TPA: DUF447 domain-containing protein [Candidatus Acidoferrum sp.]|nr:DUF447 domain-containing protein [Candidatus Acidoferrum sp.]
MEGIEFPLGISEIIATTKNERFNAAPMGVINRGGLFIKMYKNTHTFLNVKNNGMLVANLISNPLLYVKAAFEDLEEEYFYEDEGAPILKEAYAWLEFKCAVVEEKHQKTALIRLTAQRWKILGRSVRPVSRGFNAVIEATVYGTRYIVFGDTQCLKTIDYYENLVKKCGGLEERKAMSALRKYLEKAGS